MGIISTLAEIIAYVDRKYPNSETDANKCIDLNFIHTSVFLEIQRLKNDHVIWADVTVADQTFYNLPTNGKIEDIVNISIETAVDSDEFDDYIYKGVNDDIRGINCYMRAEAGTYAILSSEEPIDTAGLDILVYYYKRPITFTSADLTVVPELDTDYHELLRYGLIAELASQGHNPDTEVADFWQRKFDESLMRIKDSLADYKPISTYEVQEWM